MALFTVCVSRIVRDLVGNIVDIEAENREAAEAEAIRRWEAGEFELDFAECLDGEPVEAKARLAKCQRTKGEV